MNDLQELRLKMLEISQHKAPYEIDEIIVGAQKLFEFVKGGIVEAAQEYRDLAEEGTDTPTTLPETCADVDAHPEYNEAIVSFLINHICNIKKLNNLQGLCGFSSNNIIIEDKCFPKWFTDKEKAAIIKNADDIFNRNNISPPAVWGIPSSAAFQFPETKDGLSKVYAEKIKSDLLNEVTTEKYTKSFNEQEKRDKKNDYLISKNNIQTVYTPELEKELRSYMAFRQDCIVTYPYGATGPQYLGLMRGSNNIPRTSSKFILTISGHDLDYIEVDSKTFADNVAAYCTKDSYGFFDKIITGTEVASISGLVNESQIKFTNE